MLPFSLKSNFPYGDIAKSKLNSYLLTSYARNDVCGMVLVYFTCPPL